MSRLPISAPGSTLEDLDNDLAALTLALTGFLYATDSGFDPGNDGDPSAVVAWLKEKIAETENTIAALDGSGPPLVRSYPVTIILRASCPEEASLMAERLAAGVSDSFAVGGAL